MEVELKTTLMQIKTTLMQIKTTLMQINRLYPCSFYLSACLVVVEVHQPACVFLDLTGVYEAPRKLHAVLDISRAAPPFPALLLVVVALLLSVAAALAQVALATC